MTDHERNLYRKRIEHLEQTVSVQGELIHELQGAIQGWLSFQGDFAEVLYGNRITWKGGDAEIETVKALVKTHKDLLDMRSSRWEEDSAELKKAFQQVADEEAEDME